MARNWLKSQPAYLKYTGLAVGMVLTGIVVILVMRALAVNSSQTHSTNVGFQHVIVDSEGPQDPWGKSIGDVNGDGLVDLIIGGNASSEVVWYENPSWRKYTIAHGSPYSTDHEIVDIDSDGRNDVISLSQKEILWYKNPDWKATSIDDATLHDIEVIDLDGDGDFDIVARNQSAFGDAGDQLIFYRQDSPYAWNKTTIKSPSGEGLKVADLNADGNADVIINAMWYENPGDLRGSAWRAHAYSKTWSWEHTYIDVGDINDDGRLDILLAPAERLNETYHISWFEAPEQPSSIWFEHVVDVSVEAIHHFVGAADMDNDGDIDVVAAEMHQGEDPDEVKIYENLDGNGLTWKKNVIATTGSHSMRITDIDGDGDFDLYGANWSGEYQPVELWINQICPPSLKQWKRHVIDPARPWRSIFIAAADLDKDGRKDIVTGAWWYRNPGSVGQKWERNQLGYRAWNMAAVHDFDNDGDIDVLATSGKGSEQNAEFVWARNDGHGIFSVLSNIANAEGDFLQGVVVGRFESDKGLQVALSWHEDGRGIQVLTIPSHPESEHWSWRRLTAASQDEALSTGDIDNDGDLDLLMGTRWLRNNGDSWTQFPIVETRDNPDRNRLVDMNSDDKLDAVVGYEATSKMGKVAWYEQGNSSMGSWIEHIIGRVIGPMSLDVSDMDADDDLDIVVGEHNLADPADSRLLIFENVDGDAKRWHAHLVHKGDEHHDGTQVIDIDNDGDMDILSIGWSHSRVLLYENRARRCRPLSTQK